MNLVISMRKAEDPLMSPDILTIAIAITVQPLGLVFLGWYLSRMLRESSAEVTQITAAVTFNALRGRRIEEILREMGESPARQRR
jgi:hypothetical protein